MSILFSQYLGQVERVSEDLGMSESKVVRTIVDPWLERHSLDKTPLLIGDVALGELVEYLRGVKETAT